MIGGPVELVLFWFLSWYYYDVWIYLIYMAWGVGVDLWLVQQ